jgi:hypothetical protein
MLDRLVVVVEDHFGVDDPRSVADPSADDG